MGPFRHFFGDFFGPRFRTSFSEVFHRFSDPRGLHFGVPGPAFPAPFLQWIFGPVFRRFLARILPDFGSPPGRQVIWLGEISGSLGGTIWLGEINGSLGGTGPSNLCGDRGAAACVFGHFTPDRCFHRVFIAIPAFGVSGAAEREITCR